MSGDPGGGAGPRLTRSHGGRYVASLSLATVASVLHVAPPWLPSLVAAISCVDAAGLLFWRNAWTWLKFNADCWDEKRRRLQQPAAPSADEVLGQGPVAEELGEKIEGHEGHSGEVGTRRRGRHP
jgi:hypothetical protein